MITKTHVTKDSIIGDIIRDFPEAQQVIEKYFGTGCFTCPGIKMESIAFGALMHNMDTEKIVSEIRNLTALPAGRQASGRSEGGK